MKGKFHPHKFSVHPRWSHSPLQPWSFSHFPFYKSNYQYSRRPSTMAAPFLFHKWGFCHSVCAAGFQAFVWQHRRGRSQLRRKKIDLCEQKRGEARGGGTPSSSHSPVSINRIPNQWTARAFPGVNRRLLLVASAWRKIYVYEKGRNGGGYLWKKSYLFAVFFMLFLQLCVAELFMWL